ncbi:unnamed protein product [Parnassius apollo]|uniref:(apollo) hypothetical protein n=1 Tax=Parnassius apollo TaxID=110799 RepID=A0A8S3WIA2_PARAO|nr:unnamed protein product [Parnassius apollo]
MINDQRLQKIRENISSNLNSRRDNMENNSTHSSPERENSQEVDVHPFIIESNTPVHTLNFTLQPQPDESVISTQASEPQKNQAIENNDAEKFRNCLE